MFALDLVVPLHGRFCLAKWKSARFEVQCTMQVLAFSAVSSVTLPAREQDFAPGTKAEIE